MCLQLYDQVLLKVNTHVSDKLIICLIINCHYDICHYVSLCSDILGPCLTELYQQVLSFLEIKVSFGCIFSFIQAFGRFLGGSPYVEAV